MYACMDFLDPKKKRAHKIRLYIGYGLIAVALAIATLILVFAAYGYDIDRKTGDIIQNGLVIVDAHPESATVLVNGENKGTTDYRLVLPAAKYSIELTRSGYLPWKHDVNLEGSSIEQLVYPFMFPERLVTKNLQTYTGAPTMASESLDRKWLVVSAPETPGSFQVVSDEEATATTWVEWQLLGATAATGGNVAMKPGLVPWSLPVAGADDPACAELSSRHHDLILESLKRTREP